MDGSHPTPAKAGETATERAARRMIKSAATIWAQAGLPGERFDTLLEDGREAFRAETVRIDRQRRGV